MLIEIPHKAKCGLQIQSQTIVKVMVFELLNSLLSLAKFKASEVMVSVCVPLATPAVENVSVIDCEAPGARFLMMS